MGCQPQFLQMLDREIRNIIRSVFAAQDQNIIHVSIITNVRQGSHIFVKPLQVELGKEI